MLFAANGKKLGAPDKAGDYLVHLYGNGMQSHAAYLRQTANGQEYIDDIQTNMRYLGQDAVDYLRKYDGQQFYPITDASKLTLDEVLLQLGLDLTKKIDV